MDNIEIHERLVRSLLKSAAFTSSKDAGSSSGVSDGSCCAGALPATKTLPASSEAVIHIASIDNLAKRITDETTRMRLLGHKGLLVQIKRPLSRVPAQPVEDQPQTVHAVVWAA
jgi:hypothetical protein